MAEIKVVIFDIGNVLFHISMQNALNYWSVQTPLSIEDIQHRFSFDEAHKEFERGNISPDQYRKHISTCIEYELNEEVFFNGWNMIYLETFPEIEKVLASLRNNYKVCALSNTNLTHEQVWSWKYKALINNIDTVFASHKIGHIKPDASCYQYVLKELNIPANNCVFFDDKIENIEGAKRQGIHAFQVTSPKQLYQTMKVFGLQFDLNWAKVK